MNIATVTLPELKLAALQFAGPFSSLGTAMPKVWETLLKRESELGTVSQVRYGISMAEHDGIMLENIAAPIHCLDALPEGFVGVRIPPRRYLMVTHTGSMDAVQETYLAAFQAIENAGLEIDRDAWRLERYDERFTPTVDERTRAQNAYDILIPLKD